jgi:hypothetical protein
MRRTFTKFQLPFLAALVAYCLGAAQPSQAGVHHAAEPSTKFALVIGNSNYPDGDPVSGVADANAIAQALTRAGFNVAPPLLDAKLDQAKAALTAFKSQISAATVAVVFFSGHGFQLQNASYLLLKDGDVSDQGALPLEEVLQDLNAAPNEATKVVFVNACRTAEDPTGKAGKGLANFEQAPLKTVQFSAAAPGQVAQGGKDGNLSPFTAALVRNIPQPGLRFKTLLTRVTADVSVPSDTGQLPTDSGSGSIADDFTLRDPVVIQAGVLEEDDSLYVLLNGTIVLGPDAKGTGLHELPLQAGDNPLTLMVFHQATYHNGQSWFTPEGWRYQLELLGPGGTEISSPDCNLGTSPSQSPGAQGHMAASPGDAPDPKPCFADGEDVPFKSGSHFGKLFTVATADLFVDPMTAELELRKVDTKVWQHGAPVWEQQQGLLFTMPATQLSSILGEVLNLGPNFDVLKVAQQIIDQFKLPVKLPDLTKLQIGVRGNTDFKTFIQICMNDRDARKADFKASFSAALAGDPEPFQSFDASLSACVAAAAGKAGSKYKPGDIEVYTDLEDSTPAHP